MVKDILAEKIDKAAELVAQSQKIMVFTGAGISTESGIPDFRSPGGIWTKYDPDDFTIQKYRSSQEVRKKVWKLMTDPELKFGSADPNPGHLAIAELHAMGKLYAVVTQNVDGLHQKAGVPEEMVFELHGDMSHARCLGCSCHYSSEQVIEWLEKGLEDPACPQCGSILKPAGVFFGEQLPADVLTESERRSRTCDLCIVIGSSLEVLPAANIPYYAVMSKAKLMIINAAPTSLDSMAQVLMEARSGVVMPQIIEKARQIAAG